VAGDVEEAHLLVAEAPGLLVAERHVHPGDALALGGGPDEGTSESGLELGVAADMVAVMMGVEHMGEAPAAAVQRRHDRCRLRRVDHADRSAGIVAEQVDVVVRQGRDDLDLHPGRLSQGSGRAKAGIGRRPARGPVGRGSSPPVSC
jgi:hypothetical protein